MKSNLDGVFKSLPRKSDENFFLLFNESLNLQIFFLIHPEFFNHTRISTAVHWFFTVYCKRHESFKHQTSSITWPGSDGVVWRWQFDITDANFGVNQHFWKIRKFSPIFPFSVNFQQIILDLSWILINACDKLLGTWKSGNRSILSNKIFHQPCEKM